MEPLICYLTGQDVGAVEKPAQSGDVGGGRSATAAGDVQNPVTKRAGSKGYVPSAPGSPALG